VVDYVGRFAPTPSGPLHMGSMVAAVASWLDAKAHGGKWLLRIDDLDAPRVAEGSVLSIQNTLETFGMDWDDIHFQSEHFARYEWALDQLKERGLTYGCQCTRKDLEGHELYPGTCRNLALKTQRTMRLLATSQQIDWNDKGEGFLSFNLVDEVGDFVLRNAHGIPSYHLANVVDDLDLNITHVVRGADLVHSTVAHCYLRSVFGGQPLVYHHVPLALDQQGQKLSKQSMAPAVDEMKPEFVLQEVFDHLGIPHLEGTVGQQLELAIKHWKDNLATQN